MKAGKTHRTTSSKCRFSLKLYSKEALTQAFPCEFYEIFKNTYFAEHFKATDSDVLY